MFGKTNLLDAGFATAARAQFEAEIQEAKERREAIRGYRMAAICGVLTGVILSAIFIFGGF